MLWAMNTNKHFTSSLALLTDLDKVKVKGLKRSIIVLALIPLHPLRCPHPPLHVAATRLHPARSVTHCNALKITTSRRSALGSSPTRAIQPLLLQQPIDDVDKRYCQCGRSGRGGRAGNASLRSIDPSDPLSLLQLDADVDWNADTGATSHMTPHRHWLHNYTPKRVPIKLADNTVVYSAGVGSVVFHPNLEGKRGRAVEFSNVLHVPHLCNNQESWLS